MKEGIKTEILRLYGHKGVTVLQVRKRILSRPVFDAGGDLIRDTTYIYKAEVNIPGHNQFNVSVQEISDVKENFEQGLRAVGITLS